MPADVAIDLIGVGSELDTVLAAAERLNLKDQVRVTGRVSSREALAVIVRTPLLLVLQTRRGHDLCVPTKAYEYLRSGSPILAITPEQGDTASLLRAFVGVSIVSPDDGEGISNALAAAHRSWAAGAWPRFARDVSRYDRRQLAAEMADLLNEVNHPVRRGG